MPEKHAHKTALLIMAAGIGSRYGGGIKQLTAVGPNGELIIDYSVHDAIAAGFRKLVFIIRKDMEADFREIIGKRTEDVCERCGVEVAYAFQSLDDLPPGVHLPAGRTKPWGTGQAVLSCRGLVHEPFAVINADDYYGKAAYRSVQNYLSRYSPDGPDRPDVWCMAGFALANTLSENGGVTRGICHLDGADGHLANIVETYALRRDGDAASGEVQTIDGRKEAVRVPLDSLVSMNMFGFPPEFMGMLEEAFPRFFASIRGNEQKAEFLIPTFVGNLLREGAIRMRVLQTPDVWFGITYREDTPSVREAFRKLTEDGVYRSDNLFSDLVS